MSTDDRSERVRGRRWPVWVAAFLTLGAAAGAEARTWRLAPDGSGDAPTLQAALDSAQAGDVVLLGPGTYAWARHGSTLAAMATVRRSITLRGEAGAAATLLDAERRGRILACVDAGLELVMEDLSFVNGLAPIARIPGPSLGSNDSHGGAIDVRGACVPTIRRCIFRDNQAQGGRATGGAVACARAVIEDCEFTGNGAGVSGHTNGHGGAVACTDARLVRCTFEGNSAWGFEAASGGAVRSVSARLEACVFRGNHAFSPGAPRGGAVRDIGEPTITDCVFEDNGVDAHYFESLGGAVDAAVGTIVDCLFRRNAATCANGPGRGGALAGDLLTVRDCTFLDNRAEQSSPLGPGFGGAVYGRFPAVIETCTLVANSGGTPAGVGGLMLEEGGSVHRTIVAWTRVGEVCGGDAVWTCSDLFGNAAGNAPCGPPGSTTFSADPLFCSDPLLSGMVEVRDDSPCAPGSEARPNACGRIGAGLVGCVAQALRPVTWSAFKGLYRDR